MIKESTASAGCGRGSVFPNRSGLKTVDSELINQYMECRPNMECEPKEVMILKASIPIRRMLRIVLIVVTVAAVGAAGLMPFTDTAQAKSKKAKKVKKLMWKNSYHVHTIAPGKKFRLKVKVKPAKASKKVRYRSSNEEIATVNKRTGVVKAVKKGKCTITAISKKNSKKRVKCRIYVGKKVKQLRWKKKPARGLLFKGEKSRLKVSVKPRTAACKKLKFVSSDKKVATVTSKGIVKAKKPGKVTITVKAMDGSRKKIRCRITVWNPIKTIKLKASSHTCLIGRTLRLKKKIRPTEGTLKQVKFTSSNKRIATVSKTGAVRGIRKGKVTITAKSADHNKTARYTVYVEPASTLSKIRFTAHRGLSAKYPENTVQAFNAAVQKKYIAVETDVWNAPAFYDTSESGGSRGEFVIMHDSTITRMTDVAKKVNELNEDNIKTYPIVHGNGYDKNQRYEIPLLKEYLNVLAGANQELTIELKNNGLPSDRARALLDLIKSAGVADRTNIISFNRKTLESIYNAMDEDERSMLWLGYLVRPNNVQSEADITWAMDTEYIDYLSYYYKMINSTVVKTLDQKGKELRTWTVDDAGKALDLYRMGVDEITTNGLL